MFLKTMTFITYFVKKESRQYRPAATANVLILDHEITALKMIWDPHVKANGCTQQNSLLGHRINYY